MTEDEIVYVPDRRGVSPKHLALISGAFFVFVQVSLLDDLGSRIAFTLAFAAFLVVGLWSSARSARHWPQRIALNRSGIRSDNMKAQYGMELVPWDEVARMDLFYTDARLPPHLRLGLRPGAFRDELRRRRPPFPSTGLDVNIPVAVQVAPEAVLEAAQRFWRESRYSRGGEEI